MQSVIRWAIKNSPGMNILMISVLLGGGFCLWVMRREVFPEFDLEIILVTVPYPGATPDEVEEGICQKIEESVRAISGIKKQTSVAQENAGFMVLELESNVKDVQKVLSEVRAEIDRIPSFPELAEDPEIQQLTFRSPAIRVGVIGPDNSSTESELALREVAEEVRNDLLQLPSVSQAQMVNARGYQIDVEIAEETLRKHGLTLGQVAQIIRRENIELPGGKMTTDSQEVLLRGNNKRLTGEEIAKLPLVTTLDGVVLTVGDLGEVRDEFDDSVAVNQIAVLEDGDTDSHPGVVISIDRTASEDLLAIVEEVRGYLKRKNPEMPYGYRLKEWQDQSVDVRDRMDMLIRNGLQGLLLVFLVLSVFLDLRLAFWVALGIPISVLGAGIVLLLFGQTLNMLSMFAFLLALGIVVDDAIVIGENIYSCRQRGMDYVTAAIKGTIEVLPSVGASVCTTIIAFSPLLFVSGIMGKFIAVMPLAVIAMLLISLVESAFILPCHLSHRDNLFFKILGFVFFPLRPIVAFFRWINKEASQGLHWLIQRTYLPTLRKAIKHPFVALSVAVGILIFSYGFVRSGIVPFNLFPKLDSNVIEAKISYPDGTPRAVTERSVEKIEQAIRDLHHEYASQGMPIVRVIHRVVGEVTGAGPMGPESRSTGSHLGGVLVELVETGNRTVTSETIIQQWREAAGLFPGAEKLTYEPPNFGPGGAPIEFKVLAPPTDIAQLEAAVERCKEQLQKYPGVYDIRDDSSPGKWEYQLKVKDKAIAMGISAADLAETVRSSYYGDEVMRLQRGRHEVKLMVRYPREQRQSLADFEEIRVRTGDGSERPLMELAEIKNQRSYSEINRIDQMRSITITTDLDEDTGNSRDIVADLKTNFLPKLFEEYPTIDVRWEGQAQQSQESIQSLRTGIIFALFGMFCLLTIEFRSYLQPLIILAVIPFGIVGAIWGHALWGAPMTLFSLFGLVALTGVVVNDSIVLIDFINHRVRDGVELKQALLDSGARRFRPVLLTSVTTIAGLMPILLETSFQAQVLIPMALSLAFGLLAATGLVLVLIPTLYYLYAKVVQIGADEEVLEYDDAFEKQQTAAVAEPELASPSV